MLKKMSDSSKKNILMKEIVDNAGIVASSTWLERVVVFLTSILVVRVLGPELYGVYFLGRKIFTVIFILAVFGLDAAVVKFISGYREMQEDIKLRQIVASSFLLGLGFSVSIGLLLILISSLLENIFRKPQLQHVLFIFAFCIPFAVFLRLCVSYFQGEKRLEYLALVGNIIPPNTKLVIVIVLFFVGYRLDAVLFSVLGSFIVSSVFAAYLLNKKFGLSLLKLLKNASLDTSKKILRFSSVLFGVQFLAEVSLRIDIYMVGYFLVAAQVGIYGVILEIALLFNIVLNAFSQIFAPQISGVWEKGDVDTISELYKFVSKVAFMIVVPLFVMIVLYPENILSVFGQNFLSGKTALVIMAFGQLISCSVGGAGFILTMTEKQRFQLYNTLTGLVINTALNYVLIQKYGINGAAFATTASLILVNLMSVLEVKILYGFTFFKKSFVKPLIAGALGYLALKFIVTDFSSLVTLVIVGVLFLVFYVVALFALGFDEEESYVFKSYLRALSLRRQAGK
jgi:O-antigen/teichoic acid export membrane protein